MPSALVLVRSLIFFWALFGCTYQLYSQDFLDQLTKFEFTRNDPANRALIAALYEDFDQVKILTSSQEKNQGPYGMLARALQLSKQGHIDSADFQWSQILDLELAPPEKSLFFLLEYGEHLSRKNHVLQGDSLYRQFDIDVFAETSILRARFHQQRSYQLLLKSKLEESQIQFKAAEEIWNTHEGSHPWLAKLLNQKGLLEKSRGNFEQAEIAFQEAVAMCDKIQHGALGAKADALSNRADLLRVLGDHRQSIQLYEEAYSIYLNLGQHLDEAILLGNLAATYDGADSLSKAKALYQQALKKYEQIIGIQNIPYANTLSNFAGLLDYLNETDLAENYYRSSISIVKALLGTDNLHYTTLLSNLALLLDYAGRNQEAIQLFQEAVGIRSEVLGARHPRYVDLLFNYAGALEGSDYDLSIDTYTEAAFTRVELIKYYYSGFDEDTRLSYLTELESEFARYYSMVVAHGDEKDYQNLQQVIRATKGLVLDYSTDIRRRIDKSSRPQFEAWQQLRDSISTALLMVKQQRIDQMIDLDNMLVRAKDLEKSWTRNTDRGVVYENVQPLGLASTDVAVDFFHFKWFGNEDSIIYCAFVDAGDKTEPNVITFGTEDAFEEVLRQGFFPLEFPDQEEDLSALLVTPLEEYFDKYHRILISPSGVLHIIPFGALKYKERYLADSHEVVLRAHFRSPYQHDGPIKLHSGLVIADVDYGNDDSNTGSFFPLPGTSQELEFIQSAGLNLELEVLSETGATRQAFIQAISRSQPSLVHLATHGYSYSYNMMSGETLADIISHSRNSLIRCGLILSQANQFWHHPQEVESSESLLSAFDIANLQLSNTMLAFLSGCESGIGDLHLSEGVFGLPRSFLMAGAQSVIYSLWQIDDFQTSQFVGTFYKHLAQQGQVRSAFTKTLRELMHLHPFYWAGFVLLEK